MDHDSESSGFDVSDLETSSGICGLSGPLAALDIGYLLPYGWVYTLLCIGSIQSKSKLLGCKRFRALSINNPADGAVMFDKAPLFLGQ